MSTISRRRALAMLGMASATLTLGPSLGRAGQQTIVCNWDKTFPPYSMEQDGKMTGILIDCMDDILGRRMGFTVSHRGYEWPEAQRLVQTGEADALCTNPTDPRRQYLLFSEEPVVESLPSIFCAVDNPRREAINVISTVGQLRGFRQVDYKGNGWAKRTFPPDLPIIWVDDLFQAFTLIDRGEADIFVGNGLAAMYTIKKLGLKQRIAARELPIGAPSSFHFGLRRDFPDAASLVMDFDAALEEAMLKNATRQIIMHYL